MKRWIILALATNLVLVGAVAAGWYFGSLPIPRHAAVVSSPTPTSTPAPTPTPDTRWFGDPAIWDPPDIVGARIEYVSVSGTSQYDLITSLNAAGLKDSNGLVAWGLEGSSIPSGVCYSPRTVNISLDIVVMLPRWSPIADGRIDQDLVTKWNALQQVIYIHEVGHVKIDLDDWSATMGHIHQLPSCQAAIDYLPAARQKRNDDQDAYHARLKADCRPEIGCFLSGWLGW